MWQCNDCKFWKIIEKESYKALGKNMGECRFNAPNMIFYRKQNLEILDKYPIFPLMSSTDYCGRFINKNEKETLLKRIFGKWK